MFIQEHNILDYKGVSCIYSITSPSGKVYVGQTKNLYIRFFAHKLGKSKSKIAKAFKKYGFENFYFSILELVESTELTSREQYWMDHYDSCNLGYNLCPVAGFTRGIKLTEERKKGISNKLKGIKRSKEVYYKAADTKEKLGVYTKASKEIEQIDPNTGEVVKVYRSINKAHLETKIPRSTIQSVIGSNGKLLKLAGGYFWRLK